MQLTEMIETSLFILFGALLGVFIYMKNQGPIAVKAAAFANFCKHSATLKGSTDLIYAFDCKIPVANDRVKNCVIVQDSKSLGVSCTN